jgi:hypothetical protein
MMLIEGSRQKVQGKRFKAKDSGYKWFDFVPFVLRLEPVIVDFNRDWLVVKIDLWYKGRFIFVINTHAYRHVW